ncbi:armadillo-like helical domain-containing protein 4 isoform X2 [Electrophorus electricus]|uniref:armadillo-like helical domain-containing protein 4 isoform X2 n=1 Tax=Electrophorus electricus TaxID=8005 RepID=UPI0015CFA500|nr:armadillo-like helical domain-containing protein 4 isoform X2 [Electrophorus electricus]
MLHCKTFRVLFLAELCLSTWGAPLGSTSSPQARNCGRTKQGSKETPEHLAGHHNGKLCMISQMQLHSSSRLPEWLEPRGTAEVLPSAKQEEEDAVTGVSDRQNRQVGLVNARAKPYAQYQEAFNKSIDESSSEEKNKSPSSATISESIAAVEHTLGLGNVNTMRDLVSLTTISTSAADQINTQKYTVQNGKSKLSHGVSNDRPAQTQAELGYSDNLRSGRLLYNNAEEDTGTFQPLTSTPFQEIEEWKVKGVKKNISAKFSPKHWGGVSTEPPFFIQSPWAIGPVVTSLTTSGSSNGQSRGATGDNERVAEESFFTTSELQDKAVTPGFLQPDLTLSSRQAALGVTWTESLHLQGVEEASILPLSQEVGPEATMSSEDLPLIFAPFDDVTPPRSSALAFELSVAMAPMTGMLEEGELEQAESMDADHTLSDVSLLGPSDWPSPWQMSGAENSDTLITSQIPINKPFSEADLENSDRTGKLQSEGTDVIPTSVGSLPFSSSPSSAPTQQITDIEPTRLPELKPKSWQEELESEEDEDEEDEDVDESEEEEIGEDISEAPAHITTQRSYSLIPQPPIWGHQNQGLIRSWVELIREKAGNVSSMLAPVGIGIAGALLIVGALYGIRMIHRKRQSSFKHQRRKLKEVRNGPDQAMLLADSSEDEL